MGPTIRGERHALVMRATAASSLITSLPLVDVDVCLRKVITDEQQRFAARHCQRVTETIAEVEPCDVPATAKTQCGVAREHDMFVANRNDFRTNALKESVQLRLAELAETAKNDE